MVILQQQQQKQAKAQRAAKRASAYLRNDVPPPGLLRQIQGNFAAPMSAKQASYLQRKLGNRATTRLVEQTQMKADLRDTSIADRTAADPNLLTPSLSMQDLELGNRHAPRNPLVRRKPLEESRGNARHQLVSGQRIQRFRAPTDMRRARRRFDRANRNHDEDRRFLRDLINEVSRSRATRLRNSAEWILKRKAKLFAITRTGDSDERVVRNRRDRNREAAFFPIGGPRNIAGDIYSGAVTYNWTNLDDNAHVEFEDTSTNGWNFPGYIAIVNPRAQGRNRALVTLCHEVQHDADQSDTSITNAPATPDAQFEEFATEYRAYNYEGGEYDRFRSNRMVRYGGHHMTEKQSEIVHHVKASYDHTSDGWRENRRLSNGLRFREAVARYQNPDRLGFNKINSVRVDDFYNALGNVDRRMRIANGEVQDLRRMAENLYPYEARYIVRNNPMYRRMRRKMSPHVFRFMMRRLEAVGRG